MCCDGLCGLVADPVAWGVYRRRRAARQGFPTALRDLDAPPSGAVMVEYGDGGNGRLWKELGRGDSLALAATSWSPAGSQSMPIEGRED